MLVSMLLTLGCGEAPDQYPLTGTVVEVREDELLVAHDDIPGFMTAMTMPIPLANPTDDERVREGDTIRGTLVVGRRTVLTDVVVTARSAAPRVATPRPGAERRLEVGATFPATPVLLSSGETLVLGPDQAGPVALTFVYTRCPLPEFCPLVMRRILSLQADLPEGARALAVSIDPAYDTVEVLKDYAERQGAIPGKVDLGRVSKESLVGLAERSGLSVQGEGLEISHDLVMVILDAEGRVTARYDDMAWDRAEVLGHLGG